MVEVLGAVASATQLAVMTMSLLEVVRKIKGGSKTLKRYQQQLLEVQALSESISKNPLLQTPDVDFHTRSILSNISQTNLEHRLRRGWFSRTCTFIYRDQDLVDFFLVLDRQKSSLSLVIENIQSRTLHQIQADLQTMSGARIYHDTPPPSDDESSYPAPRVPTETSTKTRTMASPPPSASPEAGSSSHPQSSKTYDDTANQPPMPSFQPNAQTIQSLVTTLGLLEKLPRDLKGCHYIGNEAHGPVYQHVGPMADFSIARHLTGDSINQHRDSYTSNTKVGQGGGQTVGQRTILTHDDEVEDDSQLHLPYDALFANNLTIGERVESQGTQQTASTTQVIGPTFVRMADPRGQPDMGPARSFVIPVRQSDEVDHESFRPSRSGDVN